MSPLPLSPAMQNYLEEILNLSSKHDTCLLYTSVFISSAQRGFLYDPEALVYCENCGRLLVRFTEEETRTDWVE